MTGSKTVPGAAAGASGTASTASGACSWTSAGAGDTNTTLSVTWFLFFNSARHEIITESGTCSCSAEEKTEDQDDLHGEQQDSGVSGGGSAAVDVKRGSWFKDPAGGLTCPGTCEWFVVSNAVMALLINTPEPQSDRCPGACSCV